MKHVIKKALSLFKLLNEARLIKLRVHSFSSSSDEHQNKKIEFYSTFIQPDDLCFDVGAYIGDKTAALIALEARVVCVEPQPTFSNYLRKLYKKYSGVTVLNCGLADKEGILPLYICEDHPTVSTMSEKWKGGRFKTYSWSDVKEIKVTTLDQLIRQYGVPRFIKIDVEGFELAVIKGLSQKVNYICFEFTKEFLVDAKKCVNYLISLGNIKLNCVIGEVTEFAFENWVDVDDLYLLLEETDDQLMWGDIYVKFETR